MLHEFVTVHREEIVARTRQRVGGRTARQRTEVVLEHGVPLFLEQLAGTLRREQETLARPTSPEMARSALLHGAELRRAGFTVGEVVHAYGDVCQAVTELAIELGLPISADEFKTLNRCLDEAIAQAVTEYSRQRDLSLPRGAARHAFFVHEQRNLLHNAILAFEALKTGTVGIGGSTGGILGRNLIALRNLIDRSLIEVRLQAGLHHRESVALSELVEEAGLAAGMEARARALELTVTAVEPGVVIDVDRELIAAALANLLQNAFKFSRPNGHVVLRADTTSAGSVRIEVEDECGGLPPGQPEDLFRPFAQRGTDRSGLGLGLAVARESVAVNGGEIRVRNLPGTGCVFTMELPRLAGEPAAAIGPTVICGPG
jgi:signal transduction histidine kinase